MIALNITICEVCDGSGGYTFLPCKSCNGVGYHRKYIEKKSNAEFKELYDYLNNHLNDQDFMPVRLPFEIELKLVNKYIELYKQMEDQ